MTALYRKYRPQGFDEVVGQEAVVRTLTNAIEHDQVRQAYLFAGPSVAEQLSAFARMRAIDVLPVPRGPAKR